MKAQARKKREWAAGDPKKDFEPLDAKAFERSLAAWFAAPPPDGVIPWELKHAAIRRARHLRAKEIADAMRLLGSLAVRLFKR